MTSPIDDILILAPAAATSIKDWYRASMNLGMDDFDDEYLDDASSAKCPDCGHKVVIDTLIVDHEGIYGGLQDIK